MQVERGRIRVGRAIAAVAVATLCAVSAMPAAGASAASIDSLRAVSDGRPIDLADVSAHYCHDRDYPVIRCFDTVEELEASERVTEPSGDGLRASGMAGQYVRWFRDSNYSGPAFDAFWSYVDLAAIGWDNQISSFQTIGGGHPVWYDLPNYGAPTWDWGTTSIPSIGSANDRFSSVMRR